MKKSKSTTHKANKNSNKKGLFANINGRLLAFVIIVIAILGTYLIFNTEAAPKVQPAVTLSLSPSSQRVLIGEALSLAVKVDTNGQNVNAVEAAVSYPTDKLEYVSADGSGSAFSIEASTTASAGIISVTRANITPVSSSNAQVATINFRALASGRKVSVKLNATSKVLSSDSNTNILQKLVNGQYTIQ